MAVLTNREDVALSQLPKLSVDKLSIAYVDNKTGDMTKAVEEVSLTIQPGEFVSIVGMSGCGKSSFLNAVAGLLKSASGTIKVDGKEVKQPGPDRAVVFQKASLLPWRTTLKNILYGLELSGVPKAEALQRAKRYIKMAKLEGYEDFYPSALSGGMQQRVNLARALASEPEVLLMDEPFSALDAITREMLQNELLQLWEQTKKTVLMVTHQIDEAVLLSDRVIVFSARPATVTKEIEITLPRPRTPEVKNHPLFDQLTKQIWNEINKSVRKKDGVGDEI